MHIDKDNTNTIDMREFINALNINLESEMVQRFKQALEAKMNYERIDLSTAIRPYT